jgi:hypothetical protein
MEDEEFNFIADCWVLWSEMVGLCHNQVTVCEWSLPGSVGWSMGTNFLFLLLTCLGKSGGPCYECLSQKKCLSHPCHKLEVRSKLTEAITAIFCLTLWETECQRVVGHIDMLCSDV